MTTLADRVRAERIRAGLSQTALAGLDFSPSYISLIEAGRRVPTDSALAVIAERLGTSTDYLRHGDQAPSEERARLDIAFARLALINGEAVQAKERLNGIDLGAISPRYRDEALRVLASVHESLGELADAVGILEPMLEQAGDHRRWLDAATLATDLVGIYHEAGDLGRSIELGERVLADVDRAGLTCTDEHLRLASTLLWTYYERGDLLFATHRAAELLELAETDATPRGRGSIYWNASLLAEGRGDLAEARRLTERALAYLSEGEAIRDLPRLRLHFAWLLLRSEPADPHGALEHLDRAGSELALVGSSLERARCEIETGRAWLMLGEAGRAEEHGRAGLELLDDQAVLDVCHAYLLLGDAASAREDVSQAKECYGWVAERLAMVTAAREAAAVWRTLGDRLLAHGDVAAALHAYDRALEEAGLRANAVPVLVPDLAHADHGTD